MTSLAFPNPSVVLLSSYSASCHSRRGSPSLLPLLLPSSFSLPLSWTAEELLPPPPFHSKNHFLGLSAPTRRSRRRATGYEDASWMMGPEADLEAQIFEFMQKSGNPNVFPTRDELIAAGRSDLVQAIAANGGWLTFGWHPNDKNAVDDDSDALTLAEMESGGWVVPEDSRVSQERFSDGSSESDVVVDGVLDSEDEHSVAYSSGRSMETENVETGGGIEGILRRLEKERNLSLAIGSEEIGQALLKNDKHVLGATVQFAQNNEVGGDERTTRSASSESDNTYFCYSDGNPLQDGRLKDVNDTGSELSDTSMSWSLQRRGFSVTEFEAADIVPTDDKMMLDHGFLDKDLKDPKMHKQAQNLAETGSVTNVSDFDKNQIRLRLKHLESDLVSALYLLRSRVNAVTAQEGQQSSIDGLYKLSDALEFQETEMVNSQDKLRSIRARMAVLEGKIALEIIEAKKLMEEKQKRLDAAKNALSLLRTVCIVWPNSASEVLLAGSFDGWTTQRRMERSNSGIFSLYLKLYPGRYEIKFIVDGEWKIDPLQPIVHNNGYDNNLLIIT